jgi:isopentenyl phosphate kinase
MLTAVPQQMLYWMRFMAQLIDPKQAVFIKLGGSLITDKSKPMTAQAQAIRQIAEELGNCYRDFPDYHWFIGNGAGSYGHYAVQQTGWQKKTNNPQAAALVRQSTAHLNILVLDALLDVGIPAISLPPAALMHQDKTDLKTNAQVLTSWALLGAVPLLYGDIIVGNDQRTSLVPTEQALFEAASAWTKYGQKVSHIIYCTSVDGVLDKHGTSIATLKQSMVDDYIGKADGFDVSGGMRQKVTAGMQALSLTQNVHIINGRRKGQLHDLLSGKERGTRLRLS